MHACPSICALAYDFFGPVHLHEFGSCVFSVDSLLFLTATFNLLLSVTLKSQNCEQLASLVVRELVHLGIGKLRFILQNCYVHAKLLYGRLH